MFRLHFQTIITAFCAALATALILGAVVLLVRRDDNAPIEILLPTPKAATSSTQQSLPKDTELKVYLSGAVRYPGVYPFLLGDRLKDAVEAAGGATDDAELHRINLSLRVQDEAHYHIPSAGETPVISSLSPRGQSTPRTEAGSLIDLNTASSELLDTLPGIGEGLAKAIISYRSRNGPFQSVAEVANVPRIGPTTFEKIRDLVTVGDGR